MLLFVGDTLDVAGTSRASHASGAQVLKDVAHRTASGSASFGRALELLAFLVLVGFLGYLVDAVRRRTVAGRWAVTSSVVAGGVMVAVKLGSWVPTSVLFIDRRSLSPQLAQLLNDFDNAAFVVSWAPFGLFIVAAASALYGARLTGIPTCALGLAVGAAGIAFCAAGVDHISDATPIAYLLGMLWLAVVSVRLAVRPGGVGRNVRASSLPPDDAQVRAQV